MLCEGEWKNQSQVTREFLMNLIEDIPPGKWWSIPAFVKAVKEKYPDYQRPAGDYDSWFIKRESDGAYLRGFAYWDAVDGALIKYLIHALNWLGRADLARTAHSGRQIQSAAVSPARREGSGPSRAGTRRRQRAATSDPHRPRSRRGRVGSGR